MYRNKSSVTKVEAADRVNLFHSTSCRFEQYAHNMNLENLVKCLYPCADMCHFMIITKKTLAFRHRN